jgi:hypothetical protein
MKQIQTATLEVAEYEVQRHSCYSPRIRPDQVRLLWLLKQKTRKPMTVHVREALESYLHEQLAGQTPTREGGDHHG